MAAADRAVTPAARDRRLQLAQLFLCRLEELQKRGDVDLSEVGGRKHRPADLTSLTHA